ncbi:GPR1/FUN34/yaaH family-domain-containing protein [Schizophyllum amplum]|uniref:GPR1/FUN34/yaaH family-domain-containing protein n=1 Tax=Schizophyllum amplum TaxID=97359 RepID=A0A550BUP9_9AGAR|nr:GPR1/FUN34/yaaH family-domain-containing protein [Auriculariopsis ampla]
MSMKQDIEKGEVETTQQVEATPPSRANLQYAHNHNGANGSAYPPRPLPGSHIANPGTLGLFSFASTTFVLSMYNARVRSITEPNVVVGLALFFGGIAQMLAGMWEFPRGNAFGATAFTSYGAFWLSYATILIPSSGIGAAYVGTADAPIAGGEAMLADAIGIYLMMWMMVTFFLFIASLKRPVPFAALFGMLCLTFLLLGVGEFNAAPNVTRAGGITGVITAFIAYGIGLCELVGWPLGPVPWKDEARVLGRFP